MLKIRNLTENLTKTKDLETKSFEKFIAKDKVEQIDRIRDDIPRSKFLLRLVEKKIQESQMKRKNESEQVNGPLDNTNPGRRLSSGFNNDQRNQPSSYETTMKEVYQ
jgi:hypothetical protein